MIQRLEHQLGAQMGRHRPANDAAAPGVHNDREIQEAGPRADVSDGGYPELIRPVSREFSQGAPGIFPYERWLDLMY